MSYDLDWVRDVVLEPTNEKPSPGQMDMGLVAERTHDWCLCGGLISVDDDDDIMGAVARHIMSNRHKEWRVLGGMSLPRDPELFGRVPVEIDR